MSAVAEQSIAALQAQLVSGDLTSVQIVEQLIASIETGNEALNVYVDLNKEEALAMAAEADARRAQGESGALLGIPVGMKDLLNVDGQPCSCASKILDGFISPYDATAVAKLKEAGAVILGRTNMDEFAMGSSNESSKYGPAKNPVDPTRVPGGSSGGSAAAVAGNIAIATLGSDTGGSIRQPASFCGCVGLKPTYGLVSRYGLTAYASSLDQIGPLTKTVEDAASVLQVIAGHDAHDSSSIPQAVPDYSAALQKDLTGMTLGVPAEFMGEGIDPEVKASVEAAIEVCRGLGATIKEVHLPHTEYAIATYYIIATAEASANLSRFDGIRYGNRVDGDDPLEIYCNTRENGFGEEVKRRIILGTYVLSSGYYDAHYLKAQKVRHLIRDDYEAVFKECDALLGPVAPTTAYKIGENEDDPLKMYLGDICTVPINLAGVCGMSVPCGNDSAGLPIGLQIIGPSLGEEAILRVGYAYEQATV